MHTLCKKGICAFGQPVFAARKPDGGYRLIAVADLLRVWAHYVDGELGLAEIRVWFACHEMESRRCKLGGERRPEFSVRELETLCGDSERRVRSALSKLRRLGLVSVTKRAIRFEKAEAQSQTLDEMLSRVANNKRRVPVPRRVLRLLSRSRRKVLSATVLGHLLRCLYVRNGECRSVGTCKASWIASVFGVDARNAKAARSELIRCGLLVPLPMPQWHRNRYGWRGGFDLAWGQARVGEDAHNLRTGNPETPPPRRKVHRKSPPPVPNRKLLSEYKNQKPARGGPTGFLKSKNSGRKGDAPTLRDVRAEDLSDTKRTLELYRQAMAQGLVGRGEADRLKFVAAAEHARSVGTRNACGLFVSVVRRGLWEFIAQRDEDAARRRVERELGRAAPRRTTKEERSLQPVCELLRNVIGRCNAVDLVTNQNRDIETETTVR